MTNKKEPILTKEQTAELKKIAIEIEAEAIQMRIDYEKNPSNLDSGSVIEIHEESSLLKDENEKLGDIAFNIKKKENK